MNTLLSKSAPKIKNKLDYSTQFDARWWSNIPAIRLTANFILSKLDENSLRTYKLSRLKNHLKVILTNLYVARKASSRLYIAISMDKCKYKKSRRYKNIFLNYKYVSFLINILSQNGFIELHKGINYANFKRCTRIRATQKLFIRFSLYPGETGVTFRRVLPIILRDEDKNDVDFDINDLRIKEHLVNVNRINKCLSQHFVIAEVPIYDYREFMLDFAKYSGMDKYCRIYNNSDFTQGGRFYRHWTQEIKSRFRKYITIDGQSTVELDYSCLHLSMLYGLEDMTPPEGDLYELVGMDRKYRPIIKKAVNIAINAKNETSAIRAIQQEYPEFIQEYGCTPPSPKVILQAIKDTHPLVSKYLCSNYGVRLQYLDSSIAEKILLSFAKDNICCLCIHDSFIAPKRYLYRLQQVMSDYFHEYFNFTPRISSK